MNASTEKSTTTLTTYVQNLNINCKIVLVAACKETNDHAVSNKAVTTNMENLPRTSKHTPKCQKTEPQVTPTSASKKSTTRLPKPRVLFNKGTTASFDALLDNLPFDSDAEYNKTVVYSKNINPSPGTTTLSTAKTYKKLGWDNNCNVISIHNPERNTNAIRCFETVVNLLNKKLPSKFLINIKHISNPNKFNFQEILDRLREHDITFTKTEQPFENIFSGQTTTDDMILVVSTHGLHDHEDGKVGNPDQGWYFMCSIVIPRPPYLTLLFSSTIKIVGWGKSASNDTGEKTSLRT